MRRLRLLGISILPLNAPKMGDFQPQILCFERKFYEKKKMFAQAKIYEGVICKDGGV